MSKNMINNNQVIVCGEFVSEFQFNHEAFGEKFYTAKLSVERKSGNIDVLPILISERLVDVRKEWIGRNVKLHGQIRTYNMHEEGRNRLVLSVFVRDVEVLDEEPENVKPNSIFLDGYICKQPVYRMTPLGREIADLLLAVNRHYGMSDYIPCIVWGRNARFASGFEVGTHIQIWGILQSRKYQKKIGEEEFETRVAYEVSVSRIEVVEEVEGENAD